ncbi:(2Fe-2S) ferredoxin domain-containing protein [Leptolyngbya sp. AN10]|uniref:(2Fe-2S) ferredoxin domain-containing protein n=1 Tax=Leptolyngbya sp. AN10 TaxID=3423365 RepID=UPI003D31D769
MSEKPQTSQFCLKGQFLAFVVDEGKIKHLRMSIAEEEIQIKLSKTLRTALSSSLLRPLDTIQVIGKHKISSKTGTIKLTAQQIFRTDCTKVEAKPNKASFKILVCQNSKCQRKGGHKHHHALETTLRDRELHTITKIESSSCLGKCSMAPNLMLMPGKKRLSGMEPDAIATLIQSLASKS